MTTLIVKNCGKL